MHTYFFFLISLFNRYLLFDIKNLLEIKLEYLFISSKILCVLELN